MSNTKLLSIGLIAVTLLIILFCLIALLLPGLFVYIPGGEQYYALDPQTIYKEGQTFSNEEALKFINISQNDTFIRQYRMEVNRLTGTNYTLGKVAAMRYLERNPDISYGLFNPHYYKLLPAVEYILGDPWDEGINMYAFVDPDKCRVAYIGYIMRYGLQTGNRTYGSAVEGVNIFSKYLGNEYLGNAPIDTMTNVTIIDTGYNPSYNITPSQEHEMISIALNDSRVSSYLGDHDYTANVNGGGYSMDASPKNYLLYCPAVSFWTNDTGNLTHYLWVRVDYLHKTVTYVQQPVT